MTRTNTPESLQITVIGEITNLDSENFSIGQPFLIKNDGDEPVELTVRLANMPVNIQYVDTRFSPGWNPELVVEIFSDSELTDVDLKYGY